MSVLLIDNYDSFAHNLARYLRELGRSVEVERNDSGSLAEIERLAPSHIVISPGPCTPDLAGISLEVVRRFAGEIPILGVCLGHQCIGQVFGGRVVRAERVMHGKTSLVSHGGRGLFTGIRTPFRVTRYHSLVVERQTLPASIEVTAESDDGVIMALAHREKPVVGVQFHPEAVLTEHGYDLLRNFLDGTVWRSSI
ncbi:MAG: 4-amino-4-deoxychorismate synthase (2-amino-4-deoxychorismate-forming) component [Rhodospirillaceae bacterium]|nr:4-amino-4-deoxychorismate synthase (2-amino-4-deoxychorismate-forming) component [Rhodospirillaceae bacterium]